jgi:hypothetical protein
VTDRKTVRVVVPPGGEARWIHDDRTTEFMAAAGQPVIRRASHVDQWADLSTTAQAATAGPQEGWFADLSPVSGPVLGPFRTHDEAIRTEIHWLLANDIPTVTEQNNDE